MRSANPSERRTFHRAFALYEVLLGITIFALGVIALGHAVENCLNASTINAEEGVVRQILSNRMAEIQAAQSVPDDCQGIQGRQQLRRHKGRPKNHGSRIDRTR